MKRLKARLRLFHIWQVSGKWPFRPQRGEEREAGETHTGGEFFKGSFDSIPFLNSDAKRTFAHLLLRPGYMIRDYMRGQSSSYLAPLTSLIIFYAFLALVSSVASPYEPDKGASAMAEKIEALFNDVAAGQSDGTVTGIDVEKRMNRMGSALSRAYLWLHLDTAPEEVDTRFEQSVAALEATLRSQGVPRFLGQLILLTLAIWLVFRKKYGFSFPASATTASYILCQFCFFMLFAVLVSLGKNDEVSGAIMAVLMLVDFRQLFGLSWKTSAWQTLKVLLMQILISGTLLLLVMLAGAIMLTSGIVEP